MRMVKALCASTCLILVGCDSSAPSQADLQFMMQSIGKDTYNPTTVKDKSCTKVQEGHCRCELTYDKRFDQLDLMSGSTPGMYTTKITAVVQKGSARWQIVSGYEMLERHKIGQ